MIGALALPPGQRSLRRLVDFPEADAVLELSKKTKNRLEAGVTKRIVTGGWELTMALRR
jgi:hypothetical protein